MKHQEKVPASGVERTAEFKPKKLVTPKVKHPKSRQDQESPKAETVKVVRDTFCNNNTNRNLGSSVKTPSKSVKDVVGVKGSQRDRILGHSKNGSLVEGNSTRRPRATGSASSPRKGSSEKFDGREVLIKNLEKEVQDLKVELERVNSSNVELQSQNRSLSEDLAAANAKIASLTTHDKGCSASEHHIPNSNDMQLHSKGKGEPIGEERVEESAPAALVQSCSSTVVQKKIQETIPLVQPPPPPPPPPPPLPGPHAFTISAKKASSVEELYHSLSKRAITQNSPKKGDFNRLSVNSAHSSIVGEIQNRSAHLLAIKSDIETKGEFINGLINKVLAASFTDIEDIATFVDWLDNELLCLADERAVLKNFKWPEKKADAMREAAIEYRSLKLLETEVSSYKDDFAIPYDVALKKMARLLDKSERGIQRIIKLRNSVMHFYQDHKVPTDWMLDSGIVFKIKKGSRELAKKYVDRLKMELQSIRHSEKESTQETLLLQGVHFAYRAQQIAGGLDSETLCAFEEIRRWVPARNQELLLVGVPSL